MTWTHRPGEVASVEAAGLRPGPLPGAPGAGEPLGRRRAAARARPLSHPQKKSTPIPAAGVRGTEGAVVRIDFAIRGSPAAPREYPTCASGMV